MSDELKLNRLSRFHKHSPDLLLEEHSHCEVPAGCGGVVLRWRDAAAGQACELYLYTTADVQQVTLDGALMPTRRVILPYGQRVLALSLRGIPRKAAIMFSLSSAPIHRGPDGRHVEPAPLLLSTAAAGWSYTTTPPTDDRWRLDPSELAGWAPLVAAPPIPLREDQRLRWAVRRLERLGAEPIGFPPPHPDTAWVRCVFTLAAP